MRLAESTTQGTSVVGSPRWQTGCRQVLTLVHLREAERLEKSDTDRVERALKHVYQGVLPSILKQTSPGWGPGPLSSERSWEFFVGLAEDLGEWAERLMEGQDPTGASIRRIERHHREEAAGELVHIIRSMPIPVRQVVEARALGVAWKRLTTEMPDRAFFSMQEDYRRAVATLHIVYFDLVRRLS